MTTILPYFRQRLNQFGLVEWPDVFNFENVPSTELNERYHLDIGTVTLDSRNQLCMSMATTVTVRVWVKAFNELIEKRETALALAKSIMLDLSDFRNCTTHSDELKNVVSSAFDLVPISDDNDNVFRLEMQFSVNFEMVQNY